MSNMKKANDYFIGLDIGTASVGWAVTNTNLDLIKKKRRNFWGSRLFDSGQTAENRRFYRSARRKYQRRRQRIELLQSLFEKEIVKVDQEFFKKMNDSWISTQDEIRKKTADFIFEPYQKKEKESYYRQFPSIWHLRKHLIESQDEKIDLRYLYLAIHHIIKYRGNFLYTDSEFQQTGVALEAQIDRFIEYLEENFDISINRDSFVNAIKDTLSDDSITTAEKRDRLKETFKGYKLISKQLNQFINAILGYKINFKTFFLMKEKVDGYVKDGFEDEKFISVLEHLGTYDDLLEVISNIYSWGILRKLLPNEKNHFISLEMVERYKEYGQDLSELKQLFQEYLGSKEKNAFFRKPQSSKVKNYYNYNLSKKSVEIEDLYSEIRKKLKNISGIEKDKRYQRAQHRMEDMAYMKVQNTTDKGSIPHQLHLLELNKIIDNQSKFYPFLKEIKDKIVSLLTFRIPYYVGPLNRESKFAWIERSDQKLYPWNFEDVVDREKSEKNFIRKMINKCTYLVNEYALPLQSIIYQEYILLNELNTIRVNNRLLSMEAKIDALEQLFKRNNTVTITKFKKWLQIYFGENKSYAVTGLSDEQKFNGSMSSWNQFSNIGFDLTKKSNLKMAENIILWATIFSEKDTLKEKIERTYPILTEKQIKLILSLTFKGWGRLSYQLLDGIYFSLPNGDKMTILERMRTTNYNFMQIINDKENGIARKLEELMADNISELDTLAQIQELPGSPAIKKGIQQAILLVEEIKKIMKKEPKKIFIEFAREDGKQKRSSSRYKRLEEAYKALSKDNHSLYRGEVYQELKSYKHNEDKLSSFIIFLYFLQNGRCLYSGKEIDLNSPDIEIDHIIPRSYTKDNSLDNLALVLKKENQRKKDNLLLSENIIHKNKEWWDYLKRKQLMTEKKYLNLTRKKITLNAQKGFINRQLVETRQISKHVKNLLTNLYPETKVQTLKAQFNTDYRNNNKLYKSRSLNDYHHAHDAYLSVFLGEFIDRKLPWINNFDPKYQHFYEKQIKSIYSDKRYLNRDNKYGLLELIDQSDEKVNWEENAQNNKVKQYLNYKDCFITYKVEEKSGEFYQQNLSPAGKGKMIEQKQGRDPNIYGGYKNQQLAYLTLVRLKNSVRAIPIPVQINQLIKDQQITLQEYIKHLDSHYEIIKECILINTLFELNNHLFILRSSRERINGKQFILPKSLHQLVYFAERGWTYDEKQEDFQKYLKVVIDKLKKQYLELSGSERLASLIEQNLDELYQLPDEEKNLFVNESLKFFQVNSENPNFKNISIDEFKKLTSRYGRMNSISWSRDITIIDQSITGYYESRFKI